MTKEKTDKFGLDDLIKENRLPVLQNLHNRVQFNNGDYELTGRKIRERLASMKPPPRRKPLCKKVISKKSEVSSGDVQKEDEKEGSWKRAG